MRVFFVLFVFFMPVAVAFAAEKSDSKVQLALPGTYHGDEINLENGEMILYGLYADGDGYVLRKHHALISNVTDTLIDKNDEKTGKEVALTPPLLYDAPKPLILIRAPFLNQYADKETVSIPSAAYKKSDCLYSASADPVRTSEEFEKIHNKEIAVSKHCTFTLPDGNTYDLKTKKIVSWLPELGGSPDYKHTVVFTTGGKSQTIENVMDIAWAGDLDGDGKLDLLINARDHYNAIHYLKLFLSSQSSEGKLFGPAITFSAVGC